VTWTTPETKQIYDATCPWCDRKAREEPAGVTYSDRCDCGALALGAPAYDFDDLIDEAVDRFRLQAGIIVNPAFQPEQWLALFGIEFRPGGKRRQVPTSHGYSWIESVADVGPGRDIFFYWFKRT